MAFGMRVWDGAGNLALDTNYRVSRVLGVTTIPSDPVTGSLTHPGFATGTPFWAMTGGGFYTYSHNLTPAVVVGGTTLSWDWSFAGPYRSSVFLIYGVY